MTDIHNDVEKFLQEVFGSDWREKCFLVCAPEWGKRLQLEELDDTKDCYWCVGAIPWGKDRTNENVEDVRALVIDDVGEKLLDVAVDAAFGLPVRSVVSSAGNSQWMYRLSTPVLAGEWRAFFDGAKARLKIDRLDGSDAVHLFRVPMGTYSNHKKPERCGFKPHTGEHHPEAVLDTSSITPVGGSRARAPKGVYDGRIKRIQRIVALVPNPGRDYHGWMARMHQIWVLAKDKAEGLEAFREYTDRFTGIVKEDTDVKWNSIRTEDITTAGQLLLDAACKAAPDEFAPIMNEEANEVFDDGAEPPPKPEPRKGITFTPFKWMDLSKTNPRDWLYGDILLRKFISMTVAPGGVGKSSLVAVETLAQVTGKNLLGEELPSGELRVALWNLEDPYEETQKKILAAAKHYGISEADIGDRLFMDSGRDQPLVVAMMERNGPMIVRPVIKELVEQIKLRKIDVVVIDPFVSCHEVPENDNTAQDMVVKEWGRVAELGNCAVHLVDHTSKAGSKEVVTDSSRGAKAKTDAARVVRVVNRMTDIDGKTYGIVDTWRYFNTFNDKANMAPPKSRRDWFKMESVWAGNGTNAAQAFSVGAAATTPGDSMGVAVQWTPPNAKTMAAGDAYTKVIAVMGTKRWRTAPRSPDWVGNAIAQALCIDAPSISGRASINAIIKTWISEGLFKVSEQLDEKRRMKEFIELAQIY